MNSIRLSIHGAMLEDNERNQALQSAIERIVRPGDVVIDVGAGAGLLSLIAARAGAARVYAVESTPLARVAQRLADLNGYGGIVQVVTNDSRSWQPPEKANVVVSETLGFAVLEEGFRTTAGDAYERFLAPGGVFLPERIRIMAAAVEHPAGLANFQRLSCVCGFDFTAFQRVLQQCYQRAYISPEAQLGPAALLCELRPESLDIAKPRQCDAELMIEREGEFAGIALWFEADLGAGVLMSSRSCLPGNHWGQSYLSVAQPVRVTRGDVVSTAISMDDTGRSLAMTWTTTIRRDAIALAGGAR